MSWSLKKIGIWLQRVDKKSYRFSVTSGSPLSKKYNELCKSVAFAPKFGYFTDQNGPKGGGGGTT